MHSPAYLRIFSSIPDEMTFFNVFNCTLKFRCYHRHEEKIFSFSLIILALRGLVEIVLDVEELFLKLFTMNHGNGPVGRIWMPDWTTTTTTRNRHIPSHTVTHIHKEEVVSLVGTGYYSSSNSPWSSPDWIAPQKLQEYRSDCCC